MQEPRQVATSGTIILNVASETQELGKGSRLRCICRDDQGQILLAQSQFCANNYDLYISELEAIRRTLTEAQQRRWTMVELQIDVKAMVAWL